MICFWFETLKSKNKKVPTDFNFVFFMKGIYLIFDGEHALSIAKAIHIIYIIFPQLPSIIILLIIFSWNLERILRAHIWEVFL